MIEDKVELTIQINKIALMVFRTALLLNGKNPEKDADQVIEELIDGYSDAVLTKLEKAREERRKARQSDKKAEADPDEPKSDSFLIYKTARTTVMPEGSDEDVRADLEEKERRIERKRMEGKIKRWAEKRDSVPYFIIRAYLFCCRESDTDRPAKQVVAERFKEEIRKEYSDRCTDETDLCRVVQGVFSRNLAQMKIECKKNGHGLVFDEDHGKLLLREECADLIRDLVEKFTE